MKAFNLGILTVVAMGALISGSAVLLPTSEACSQQVKMSYQADIVPIFKGWCVECHQPGGQGTDASGLDLTTYEGLMQGTNFGPMVIPGDPDTSNLVVLIQKGTTPEIRMPYEHKPLPACLRRNIWSWVFEGAKDN